MPEHIPHHCGVAAMADLEGSRNVVPTLGDITRELKHRGGLGGGIAWKNDLHDRTLFAKTESPLQVIKGNGNVDEILGTQALANRNAITAIGHTRYATSGSTGEHLTHPLLYLDGDEEWQNFAFAFNGNITNADDLAEQLGLREVADTQVMQALLINAMKQGGRTDIAEVFGKLHADLQGAYNIALINGEGDIHLYRNHNGIRPLSYTERGADGYFVAASEDSAIKRSFADADIKNLEPGKLVSLMAGNQELQWQSIATADPRHCFFEWVYFANYESKPDGTSVLDARKDIGATLAKMDTDLLERLPNVRVVPVPQSANIAARGYADQARKEQRHAITTDVKDRTFTTPKTDRAQKVRNKYKFDPDAIRHQDIVLVDDSLVRGTTMKHLVQILREECQPRTIHLRLACPPILGPCYYGIDFPTTKELLARKYHNDVLQEGTLSNDVLLAMARDLGVDSIKFAPVEAIPEAIMKDANRLCMACVNGRHPTEKGQELYEIATQ